MKNAMPTRQSLGKVSTYLRMMGFNHGGQSEQRMEDRREKGKQNSLPSSTKIGAKGSFLQKPLRTIRQLNRRSQNR